MALDEMDIPAPPDKEELALIRIVGKQLREARLLCNFRQNKAAELLGIDPSQLRIFESGVDTETIPLKIINQASKIYDVSFDFLFGFTDDWERDPVVSQERQVGHWVYELQIKELSKMAVRIIKYEGQLKVLNELSGRLLRVLEGVDLALSRFREVNPKFDLMLAGSPLIYRMSLVKQLADEFKAKLVRCKSLPITELKIEE